jgi:DHA2 family multidrug resistance protein
MQGFQDVYMELSWLSVGLVLMAFMLNKNRPGQGPGAGAMH